LELLRRCYADDCRHGAGELVIEGADALVEHMALIHAPLDGSLHRVTNVTVESEDEARARVLSYIDAMLVRRDHPAGPTYQVIGTYLDDLVADAGEWRFAERRFTQLWASGGAAMMEPL
jgi:SnoaL-like domain